MPTRNSRPVPVADRVNRFSYAIRNIVAEAKAVEAQGRRVRYLNIGDPVAFGFRTPPHLVEAVIRALRDNQNGYVPSAGIESARVAVAEDYAARGVRVSPDRVLITTGTSEGIELALNALVDEGDEVLVPSPTYPCTRPSSPRSRRSLATTERIPIAAGSPISIICGAW